MAGSVKTQTQIHVLFLGTGYTARALIAPMKARGYHVTGTTRSAEKAAQLSDQLGLDMCVFDGRLEQAFRDKLRDADIIISSISSGEDGTDPVMNVLDGRAAALAPRCKWAGYLSATSVYGDRDGQWVFEDEWLYPNSERGRERVEGELAWLESGLPVHIFRLAGIYGPNLYGQSRNPLARIQSGKAKATIKPGHVVNRIHVEDIASAVLASIDRPDPGRIYNIADNYPAAPQDVLDFAAALIEADRPERRDWQSGELSDMVRSFYEETKRVDNSRAQRELGWTPQYPSYREGLMQIHKAQIGDTKGVWIGGRIHVPPEDLPDVLAEMDRHIALTRAEPGCRRFDMWQDEADPHTFHILEHFADLAAAEFHRERMKGTDWKRVAASARRDYSLIGIP